MSSSSRPPRLEDSIRIRECLEELLRLTGASPPSTHLLSPSQDGIVPAASMPW